MVFEAKEHTAERKAVAGWEATMHRDDIVCTTELTYDFSQAGVLSEPTFFRKMIGEVNGVRIFSPFRRPSCVRTGCTSHAFDLHHAAAFTQDVYAC